MIGLLALRNVPLAPRTTLGVGGPARLLMEPRHEDELARSLTWAAEEGEPTLVLGGGSNLLVADRGFDGLVVRPRLLGARVTPRGDTVEVEAFAGERWDAFVQRAVESGWAGVECLSGIPGDVGATPIQNVGAYGQEVSQTIVKVRVLDRATGQAAELDREACGFGYRDSVFKRAQAGRWVVVSVTFALRAGPAGGHPQTPGGAPALRYPELARVFAGRPAPSLAEVREAVIALRRSKSMVLDVNADGSYPPDPRDENGRSAGSFFMNPTLDAAAAAEVRARAAGALGPGEAMPEFPAGDGRVKLSAAWLIERAGFPRGTGEGRVGLSTRHALAVVNRGGATAAEIVAFAGRVREGVRDRFGVTLSPEPVLVGFAPGEAAALGGS